MTASVAPGAVGARVARSPTDVVLRYHDRARILVRGPVTGRSYVFSAEQPTQPVASRDAELLLATRYFARA